jgi:hypothetical protein
MEPHQGIYGNWQQLRLTYEQSAVETHSNYLSVAGAPFDLHSIKEKPQPLSLAEKKQTRDGPPHSR